MKNLEELLSKLNKNESENEIELPIKKGEMVTKKELIKMLEEKINQIPGDKISTFVFTATDDEMVASCVCGSAMNLALVLCYALKGIVEKMPRELGDSYLEALVETVKHSVFEEKKEESIVDSLSKLLDMFKGDK